MLFCLVVVILVKIKGDVVTKKDLKFIGAFIDTKNPKLELNYALITNGGIVATDTRKLVKFNASLLEVTDSLVHKKILKGFESVVGKDDVAKLRSVSGDAWIDCGLDHMLLSNYNIEFKFPDYAKILDGKSLVNHFIVSDLNNIHFELSQKQCFVDISQLYPLIEHSGGDWYDVFYKPQDEQDGGMVKIVATKIVDEEEVVVYEALVMGVVFNSSAKD